MTSRSIVGTINRGRRRSRQWAQTFQNFTIAAATHAGAVAIDLLAELNADLGVNTQPNITISALNINVSYRVTAASTGHDNTITTGIILMGTDAFTAGGVSLPDPAEDHADWIFWDARTLVASRDISSVDEMPSNGFLEIRNRSMRKMRENRQTLVLISRASLLQSTSIQVFVSGRSLVINPA